MVKSLKKVLLIDIRSLLEMQSPLCYKLMSNLDIEGSKFSKVDLPSKDD